jgi:Serine endopeptidase inhibitors
MKNEPNDTPTRREDAGEQLATPFFARFLERQRELDDSNTTSMTLKYPSDRDEIDFA